MYRMQSGGWPYSKGRLMLLEGIFYSCSCPSFGDRMHVILLCAGTGTILLFTILIYWLRCIVILVLKIGICSIILFLAKLRTNLDKVRSTREKKCISISV